MIETIESLKTEILKFLSQQVIFEPQFSSFSSRVMSSVKHNDVKDYAKKELSSIKTKFRKGKLVVSNDYVKSLEHDIQKNEPKTPVSSSKVQKEKNTKVTEIIRFRDSKKSGGKRQIKQQNSQQKIITEYKPIDLVAKQQRTFDGSKVVGQSLNIVSGLIGIPETHLRLILKKHGFLLNNNNLFELEYWEVCKGDLLQAFEDEKKYRHSPERIKIDMNDKFNGKKGRKSLGRPGNYFKLISGGHPKQ